MPKFGKVNGVPFHRYDEEGSTFFGDARAGWTVYIKGDARTVHTEGMKNDKILAETYVGHVAGPELNTPEKMWEWLQTVVPDVCAELAAHY